jgi:hypothetical protein
MEQVFVIPRVDFVNQRLGPLSTKQRVLCPPGIARELHVMGLVDIEKQQTAVQRSSAPGPRDAGAEAPSASSAAGPASATHNSPKRKRAAPADGASLL